MILISYDISNDKLRTKFAKYLAKFGHRIQYSVFEIDNSPKILKNIIAEVNNKFGKAFDQHDSIYIFELSQNCKITRFGYAKNEEGDFHLVQ